MSMQIVQRGEGLPLVLLPGIQGRWEYMRPAIDALAGSFRVLTFPLSGERGGGPFDATKGLDNYADQIGWALDQAGLDRAVIAGVSFGGLGALRFAAREPARTAALVLVSAPGPNWQPMPRHELYARLPWLFAPLFLAETPFRVHREMARAIPDLRQRQRFARQQLREFATAGLSMRAMAERARLIGGPGVRDDCGLVEAPTLVVAGEQDLDLVVPVSGTAEYQRLIRRARAATIENTGHLGYITRPRAFVEAVERFVREADVADAA